MIEPSVNAQLAHTETRQPKTFVPGETVIPLSEPNISPSAWHHVKAALDSGWVSSLGPYVDQFEAAMAQRFAVARTIATMNGTAAIHTALNVLNIGPGDEVIVPTLTFIASANAVAYTGATLVFWDASPNHFNADPTQLEKLITPQTKAILPVHLYGHPVAMTTVMAMAEQYDIPVIEDAAEALGGTFGGNYTGQPCGTVGTLGCLSFNGNKSMTTGTGGLIISQNEALMARAHYLINQAKDDALRFIHHEVGYNYRLSNLHAALGVAQLEHVDAWLAQRQAIVARYNQAFAKVPGLQTFTVPEAGAVSGDWLATVALDKSVLPDKTNMDVVFGLKENNIHARPVFTPLHQQRPYQQFASGSYPNADHWARQAFNLPTSAHLTTEQQEFMIERVIELVTGWQ